MIQWCRVKSGCFLKKVINYVQAPWICSCLRLCWKKVMLGIFSKPIRKVNKMKEHIFRVLCFWMLKFCSPSEAHSIKSSTLLTHCQWRGPPFPQRIQMTHLRVTSSAKTFHGRTEKSRINRDFGISSQRSFAVTSSLLYYVPPPPPRSLFVLVRHKQTHDWICTRRIAPAADWLVNLPQASADLQRVAGRKLEAVIISLPSSP